MAALDSKDTIFGKVGVSDLCALMPPQTLGREIDFGKCNVAKNDKYMFMPIPKGFCIDKIAFVQTELANADVTVTLKLESDSSTLGTIAISDSDTGRNVFDPTAAVQPTIALTGTVNTSTGAVDGVTATATGGSGAGPKFIDNADFLCFDVPNTADLTKGKIAIYLIGFQTFGEGFESKPEGCKPMRSLPQTQDNVNAGQLDPRKYEGV